MVAIRLTAPPKAKIGRDANGSSRFRGDVEGLRAVAVLLVVLDHANVPGFQGGFVGVDVFFVISGFLITGLLLDEINGMRWRPFANFYARRVRRILPLAAVVTVVVMLISYPALGVARANTVAQDGSWTAIFLGNVHFALIGTDYFAQGSLPSPLQHYWSLGVEEQFYLVWPLLLGICALTNRRCRRQVIIAVVASVCIVSLVWSIHQSSTNPAWAYFSPFTRAFELGLGALVASARPRHARIGSSSARHRATSSLGKATANVVVAVGIGAIFVSSITFNANSLFPGYLALVPVLGACAVIIGGSTLQVSGTSAILGTPLLRFIGERSYSFYLWHYPFLIVTAGYIGHSLGFGWNILLVLAAFIVSCLSFQFLENPIRHSRWLRERPAGVTLAFGLAIIIAVLAIAQFLLAAHAVHYNPGPTPIVKFP
jgi:peptidoglycan/LPS O-acetylase OafA/YrhL